MIINTETLINCASKVVDGVIVVADKIRNSEAAKKIAISMASGAAGVFAKRKMDKAMAEMESRRDENDNAEIRTENESKEVAKAVN